MLIFKIEYRESTGKWHVVCRDIDYDLAFEKNEEARCHAEKLGIRGYWDEED